MSYKVIKIDHSEVINEEALLQYGFTFLEETKYLKIYKFRIAQYWDLICALGDFHPGYEFMLEAYSADYEKLWIKHLIGISSLGDVDTLLIFFNGEDDFSSDDYYGDRK